MAGGRENAKKKVQSAVYIQAYMETAMNFLLVHVSVYKHVSGVKQDTFLILLKKGNFFSVHAMTV